MTEKMSKKCIFHGREVLVHGGPIHGANGIAFSPDDKLYVGSINGGEVLVLSEHNKKCRTNKDKWRILDRFGYDRGVQAPDDLVFSPDGTFYVAMPFLGLVGHFTADGHMIASQYVGRGVNPITISDDGRLFIGLSFYDDALYEVDPELQQAPRLLASNLGFLNAMDWGPDGYLYAPAMIPGKILRIDVNSDPVVIQTVAEGFSNPSALKFNSRGELFVIGKKSGKLWRVDSRSGDRKLIAAFEPFVLDNLAFDSKDRLFISSSTEGWISEVSLHRGKTRVVQVVKGGLVLPAGIAAVSGGNGHDTVFVADMTSLRRFDGRTGKQIDADYFCIADAFWSDAYDGITHSITVSAADMEKVAVTSWVTGKVQIWNPLRKEIVADYSFSAPTNAIFFQDELFVADLATGGVVRPVLGGFDIIIENLIVPVGMAADGNRLWVSDWASGIVWQTSATDGGFAVQVPVATGLSHPEGIAFEKDGCLLVVESGARRLSRIDLQTKEVSVVKEGLDLGLPAFPFTPPTYAFNGVAVGSRGAIYVTGDSGRLVYRFHDRDKTK